MPKIRANSCNKKPASLELRPLKYQKDWSGEQGDVLLSGVEEEDEEGEERGRPLTPGPPARRDEDASPRKAGARGGWSLLMILAKASSQEMGW